MVYWYLLTQRSVGEHPLPQRRQNPNPSLVACHGCRCFTSGASFPRRLRKAIRITVQGARAADHDISRNLNAQMMSKIGQTRGLKSDLERQLGRVKEEASRTQSQRSSLVAALEAKR